MKLVDVHCHLNHARFEKDLDEVVERFRKAGGEVLVTSGVNKGSNREALELANRYGVVRASFGIYPVDALAKECEAGAPKGVSSAYGASAKADKEAKADGFRDLVEFDVDEELAWIEAHADDCVAIGEIGLDYNFKEFQSEEMREAQKRVFRKCLKLAKKIGKAVVIHSRKAEADAIEILEEEKIEKVIMHCFNGKKALIRRCVENGWSFSVPAVIMRLEHFKMLVEMVPLGQILTETDAPYLSPVVGVLNGHDPAGPNRNESANVAVTLKEIARIKGLDVEEVGAKVFENFENLF